MRVALCFVALSLNVLWGQGTKDDYDRANGLRERLRDRIFRTQVEPQWLGQSGRFWYRIKTGAESYEFVFVDAENGVRRPAFDPEILARELERLFSRSFKPSNLPLEDLMFDDSGRLDSFRIQGRGVTRDPSSESWKMGSEEGKTGEKEESNSSRRRRGRRNGDATSPDGGWQVEIRAHNVWLIATESKEATQLTFEGNQSDGYIESVYWAPNSSRFVVLRERPAQEHLVYLLESRPEDQLQPKLHEMQYLKPGDQVSIRKPHLFDVASQSKLPLDDSLYQNPYHIRGYRWAPDSKSFYFVYNQRGHQVLRVIAVDGFTGHVRTVVDERSETFIDYAYKQFSHFADEESELIWMSERDGWNHLYLYDLDAGQVKYQITQGEWVVRRVDHVDRDRRQIWFQASGVYPEQDPYYLHFCRVNFDGSDFTILTKGDGTHRGVYSPDRRFLVTTHSRVDSPPVTELRRTDSGDLIIRLEGSRLDGLKAAGWPVPERFVAKGRDGVTDIHGVIFRPSQFDPNRKYPIIEHIYAGPHGSHVPKEFRAYRSSQVTAELGFIVVRIDGMGTSNRSKAFHDVCWQNLKDAGFPDRILWMQAAAEKYPYMDTTRVGIYGGSAGGQNTVSALLHFPEFYDVGVADCGCHDNRMDKIWWNELWMGWPIGPHYADNANKTHAANLKGKLFLTVGEMDRNVDPASTLQLVDALVKAGKDFDFMMMPGAGHGVGDGSPYLIRRRQDFFVRHLHGVEPRRASVVSGVPDGVREAFALAPFYRKHLDAGGFPIVSSDRVSDDALKEARYLIDRMLEGRDDIRRGLIDLKFRFSVMAYDEFTTDIPEHSDLTPARFWDRRARGLGATRSRPSVSCGEENLLQFPGDPYNGENILIHEFAHAIHEALRVIDPGFDARLESLYEAAREAGLWEGKYAATNRYEYWAECVQSFFDDNRENDRSHNHVDTRAELAAYDPQIFKLIQEVFRDNPWRYVPPKQRETQSHLRGYDFSSAPEFVWPEHLVDALNRNRSETGERLIEIVERQIEGWTVDVDIQLLEGFDEALGRRALDLLEHQLFGVRLLMPEERLRELQKLRIRIDRDNKTLNGIQYHPSEKWLIDNGHDRRLAKVVHIPQAARFVSRSLSAAQPRVILHELAHAYHDQVLGFDHPDVLEAFRSAKDGGRYGSVKHIRGNETRHYALTDHKEYFAEGTEAYFGANDFYPFVRAELKEHDPTLYELLRTLWGAL